MVDGDRAVAGTVGTTTPGSAPLTELRLAASIHVYEQIKLGLLIAVLLINLAIGGYLLAVAHTNQTTLNRTKQSLVILECAINKDTYQSPAGKPLTQQESRAALDACLARGGPVVHK